MTTVGERVVALSPSRENDGSSAVRSSHLPSKEGPGAKSGRMSNLR